MAYPRAKILRLDETGFAEIRYEDTEYYAVTCEFVNDHRRRLDRLFAHDD